MQLKRDLVDTNYLFLKGHIEIQVIDSNTPAFVFIYILNVIHPFRLTWTNIDSSRI